MNLISSLAFGLLILLAWVQVIGTLYVYTLSTKQTNEVRAIAGAVAFGYLLLAIVNTLTFVGWI